MTQWDTYYVEADSSETLPLSVSLISQQTQPQLINMLRDTLTFIWHCSANWRSVPGPAEPNRPRGKSKNVERLTPNTSEAKLMRHESTSAALEQ